MPDILAFNHIDDKFRDVGGVIGDAFERLLPQTSGGWRVMVRVSSSIKESSSRNNCSFTSSTKSSSAQTFLASAGSEFTKASRHSLTIRMVQFAMRGMSI